MSVKGFTKIQSLTLPSNKSNYNPQNKKACCALPFATGSLFDRSGGKSQAVKLV